MSGDRINFQDTEVAFRHKSDGDLRMQHWLFRAMGSRFVVQLGKVASKIAQSLRIPVGWAVRPTLYRHFVVGETLDSSVKTLEQLYARGVQGVMDYSAEGGSSEEEIEHNFEENLAAVRFTAERQELSHAVFKVSGIGPVALLEKGNEEGAVLTAEEQVALATVKTRFMKLCQTAHDLGVPVLVDAEHYAYQGLIDRWTVEAIRLYNRERAIVFATLQMYRHDRMDFLRQMDKMAQEEGLVLGVKLVRGAYMEEERARAKAMGYPDPICPTKQATDDNFNQAVNYVMERLERYELFCGTHNEQSTRHLMALMQKVGLSNDDPRVYFSQLYGMSDNLTYNLAEGGYRVAKYCPYAPVDKVLPYLLRRAEENTSVQGQSSRELMLIKKEVARRKNR